MRRRERNVAIGLGIAIIILIIMLGISPMMKSKIKDAQSSASEKEINANDDESRDKTAVITDKKTTIVLGVYSLITGDGAEISGPDIKINEGGTYFLSGALFDGTIYVNTNDEIILNLDNVNITSNKEAIVVNNSSKVKINITGDNNLVVNSDYALRSNGDIIIEGEGKLLAAGEKMGILSDKNLMINSGTVMVIGNDNFVAPTKSAQKSFVFKLNNYLIEDTTISLVNVSGKTIWSAKLPKKVKIIMISSANINVSENYNLLRNNVEKLKINEVDSFSAEKVINCYGM